MAEQLALAEQIEHAPVEHDLDCAAAHDAQVLDRPGALGEDRRAGGVELVLGRRGHALDVGVVERVERRVAAQEATDLGRPGGAHGVDLMRRLPALPARRRAERPP